MTATTPPEQILASNTPALSDLGKDAMGGMMGVNAFDMQLVSLVEYLGASMSAGQLRECAELAYQEYYWLTMAELKQFIMRVKTSHYTSHKNFSPAVFMEFLGEYTDERLRHRYNHFSQLKPKPPVILPIDKIINKPGRIRARQYCAAIAERKQQYLEQMKDIVGRVVDGMTPDELTEEDYKQIRAEYYEQKKQSESQNQQ